MRVVDLFSWLVSVVECGLWVGPVLGLEFAGIVATWWAFCIHLDCGDCTRQTVHGIVSCDAKSTLFIVIWSELLFGREGDGVCSLPCLLLRVVVSGSE